MLTANFLKQCALSSYIGVRTLYICPVLEAARRGTRMRKEALKKARKKATIVVQKQAFVPYKKRLEMEKMGKYTPRQDDDDKEYPIDDVYYAANYKWTRYTIPEAVALLAETQHPSQYNNPSASIMAHIELRMAADKKNQYIREFSNVIYYPHHFEVPHYRSTFVICTDDDMIEETKQAGATFSFNYKQVLKMAKKGEIDFKKYNHVICHSSLLPELIGIRAYLGKKFPSPREGTASHDIMSILPRFVNGIEYSVKRDKIDLDFGKIEVQVGKVDMKAEEIEANLLALMEDVERSKPNSRTEKVISLVTLFCREFNEHFMIDHCSYLSPADGKEEERTTAGS